MFVKALLTGPKDLDACNMSVMRKFVALPFQI